MILKICNVQIKVVVFILINKSLIIGDQFSSWLCICPVDILVDFLNSIILEWYEGLSASIFLHFI